MKRRFVDTDRWQALRKLESRIRKLYDYCWDMADASGVYEVDLEYLKIDTGEKYKPEDFEKLPKEKVVKISAGKFLFIDFILVNYGTLRINYNPHKPAFRDLEKNKLEINSSLNQACFKLEKEEEYKKEDEEEINGGMGEILVQVNPWPLFSDFWNEYDKKVGEKQKIEKKWDQLSQEDKESIMAYLPLYIKSTPDKTFRKNPETFLNNKSWNDEIINKNGSTKNTVGTDGNIEGFGSFVPVNNG